MLGGLTGLQHFKPTLNAHNFVNIPGERVRWPYKRKQLFDNHQSAVSHQPCIWPWHFGYKFGVEDIFEMAPVLSTEEALPSLVHLVVDLHHLKWTVHKKSY